MLDQAMRMLAESQTAVLEASKDKEDLAARLSEAQEKCEALASELIESNARLDACRGERDALAVGLSGANNTDPTPTPTT
jgi:chromosome segregation ATPase